MSNNKHPNANTDIVRDNSKKLHNLSIAIIANRDEHGDFLVREIQKTRAKVQHIWPMPEEVPTGFDVVFCELVDDLPTRFKNIPGNVQVTFIVVIPAHGQVNQQALENSVPHAVIYLPCRAQEVLLTLIVAHSNFQYEKRLCQRIEKLDDNLRSMKTIERAKVIIMQCNNLNEEDAYKHLRRKAMQRRVTIGMLASSIVDSKELLG